MYIEATDYGLTEIIEQNQIVVFDTSAFAFKRRDKNSDEVKNDTFPKPSLDMTIQYLNTLIEFFNYDKNNNGKGKKLVVPKKVIEELTFRKECSKKTEEKLYRLFDKQNNLLKVIRNHIPVFSKEENDKLWNYLNIEKHRYLDVYRLSRKDRTILATALALAENNKCALLTNDSGMIKAALYTQEHYDLTNILSENLNVYTMIDSKKFRVAIRISDNNFLCCGKTDK